MHQIWGLDYLVERVISMHEVANFIFLSSSDNMVALISQLGESNTEGNIISDMKAPCSIQGQSTFADCISSYE